MATYLIYRHPIATRLTLALALLTTAVEAHDFMAPLSAVACLVLLADTIAWRYWPGTDTEGSAT